MLNNLWIKKIKWRAVSKIFFLTVFLLGPLKPAAAGEIPFTAEWKDFTFYTPMLSDPALAYLYNLVGKESLTAGETTLADWKGKLYLTAGGIFEPEGKGEGELKKDSRKTFDGIPFVGLHVRIPIWKVFHVGAFFARDWESGKNLAGPKADIMLRFW